MQEQKIHREVTSIDVAKVVVKETLRDSQGDMAALENSIRKMGLLHPIIIDRRNVLIAGWRRLQACRNIGIISVPAIRVEAEHGSMESLDIQSDENLCRESLTPEELEKHIGRKKSSLMGGAKKRAGLFGGLKKLFAGGKSK